jgi:hypothetical protein
MTGEFRTSLRTTLGRIPADPFNPGQPFRYESDGSKYTLWSIGPNRVDDGGTVPYDPFMNTGRQKAGDMMRDRPRMVSSLGWSPTETTSG